LIHAGALAAIGSPREVKQTFANRRIVEARGPDPVALMRALDAMPEVEKTSLFGTSVHAVLRDTRTDPEARGGRLRQSGLDAASVVEVPPSLEDVFLDVVEKASRRTA
jgi:hypothetical protein